MFDRPRRWQGPGIPGLILTIAALGNGPATAQGPPPEEVAPATSPREAELEARLLQLEEANRLLADQMRAMVEEVRALLGAAPPAAPGAWSDGGGAGAARPVPGADVDARPGARAGDAPPVTPPGDRAAPTYRPQGFRRDDLVPLRSDFGPGFQFGSEDGEFQLQVHAETQLDLRVFNRDPGDFAPGSEPFARTGFYMPRTRLLFNGRLTRPVEYAIQLNRGFAQFDVLDAFVNLRLAEDRLQLRVGRFMTPWNYEQFAVQNMWLITPERSLFTQNLGLNRMVGAMAWGQAARQRVDYALGFFNGIRNSFEDTNDAKDVMAYLNVRPFQADDDSVFRNLNLGGSFTYGTQDNPPIPRAFRTATNASNAGQADLAAPPFFRFNDGVLERGQRTFWSAHLAYFYEQLSLLADYNGAILRYAREATALDSAVLPASGYSVALGYFLTGETLERRTIVDPLRPFSLRRGRFGLGAVELVARYGTFHLDPEAFEADLANPENWSNRAWTSNLGFNWYPNRYLKLIFDWQHAEFGSPVLYALPDRRALTNDMFWFRFQLYF